MQSNTSSKDTDVFTDLINGLYPYSSIFFITLSLYLFTATLYYCVYAHNKKHFVVCLVCCLDSFLIILLSLAIFLHGLDVLFIQPSTAFKMVVWSTNACINTTTFVLFWYQRKDFYKYTAVINNTSRMFEHFELVTLCLYIFAEISKFLAITQHHAGSTDEYCDIGMPKSTAILYTGVNICFKLLLFGTMLQPIVKFWSRLKSSSTNRFDTRLRRKVVRPAVSAFVYMTVNLVYAYPYKMSTRNVDCNRLLKVVFFMLQFLPMFFILIILLSFGTQKWHVFPFFHFDKIGQISRNHPAVENPVPSPLSSTQLPMSNVRPGALPTGGGNEV